MPNSNLKPHQRKLVCQFIYIVIGLYAKVKCKTVVKLAQDKKYKMKEIMKTIFNASDRKKFALKKKMTKNFCKFGETNVRG